VLFDRRSLLVLAALAPAAPLGLALAGPRFLVAWVLLWTGAVVLALAPLRGLLVREWAGAAFVLLTATSADYLDDVLGVEQRVTLALVLLAFAYLIARREDTRALLRSPPIALLALFFVQQLASAWIFNREATLAIASNRAAALACVLAGAVLARRPDGARALAALSVAGALASVPVMLFELWHPEATLFSVAALAASGPQRAGGLFAQANEVGSALSFAAAFLLALASRGEIARSNALALFAALVVGLFACASRGALAVVLALVAVAAFARAWRRAGRAPLATAALAVGVLAVGLPPLARSLARLGRDAENAGFEQAGRLDEVLLVLAGSTEELAEDDSSRSRLAAQALELIAERPLFGRGTRNFSVEQSRRSHVQFLEVLGENGVVGGLLYAAFLAALVLAVKRAPPGERAGGALVLGAWLLTHFDNHDVLEYRFMLLPVAYVCALDVTRPRAPPAVARGDRAGSPIP
jgi:O-antigen ligase